MSGFAAACVGLAAVAVMWPQRVPRARWRRLFPPAAGHPRSGQALLTLRAVTGRRPLPAPTDTSHDRAARDLVARVSAARGRVPAAVLVAGGVAVMLAVLLGGPVAGAVTLAYAAVAARLAARRTAGRDLAGRRTSRLDLLAAVAADLRAGLPAGTALAGLAGDPGDPLRSRVGAAVRLAERTGAPLADVLERIEADARGADRARAACAAQTAGSRATAWLLAGLPVAGIGLGYAIGADPLAVLLHTPIGAACAAGAVALQLAGLAWTGRIIHGAMVAGS